MAHTVTVELDTEDVHDLLMALDVIEMLSQDGANAHLVGVRDDQANSLTQEGYVLLSDGLARPTRALMEALAMSVLATYRKSKTGELVEK